MLQLLLCSLAISQYTLILHHYLPTYNELPLNPLFRPPPSDISDVLYEYLNDYELPCFGFVGPTIPVLVLGDPGDVNTFLSDPNALQKPYIYNFFKNERGLVTSARKLNIVTPRSPLLQLPLSFQPTFGKSTERS